MDEQADAFLTEWAESGGKYTIELLLTKSKKMALFSDKKLKVDQLFIQVQEKSEPFKI